MEIVSQSKVQTELPRFVEVNFGKFHLTLLHPQLQKLSDKRDSATESSLVPQRTHSLSLCILLENPLRLDLPALQLLQNKQKTFESCRSCRHIRWGPRNPAPFPHTRRFLFLCSPQR